MDGFIHCLAFGTRFRPRNLMRGADEHEKGASEGPDAPIRILRAIRGRNTSNSYPCPFRALSSKSLFRPLPACTTFMT